MNWIQILGAAGVATVLNIAWNAFNAWRERHHRRELKSVDHEHANQLKEQDREQQLLLTEGRERWERERANVAQEDAERTELRALVTTLVELHQFGNRTSDLSPAEQDLMRRTMAQLTLVGSQELFKALSAFAREWAAWMVNKEELTLPPKQISVAWEAFVEIARSETRRSGHAPPAPLRELPKSDEDTEKQLTSGETVKQPQLTSGQSED